MAFPFLFNKARTAQVTSGPFTTIVSGNSQISFFLKERWHFRLDSFSFKLLLALICDKVKSPSRMGHCKQELLRLNQDNLREGVVGLGGLFGSLSTK